jgi:hypothetical protein
MGHDNQTDNQTAGDGRMKRTPVEAKVRVFLTKDTGGHTRTPGLAIRNQQAIGSSPIAGSNIP